MLVAVERMAQACRRVAPVDRDVAGAEHLAQLVADEVDDGLEAQGRGHAALDAADHGELAGAPLELGCLLGELARLALGDGLAIERDRGGIGKGGEQIAIGATKASLGAVDVGVQEAEHGSADQWGDDARALLDDGGAGRPMAQARVARAPRLVEPGAIAACSVAASSPGGRCEATMTGPFGIFAQQQDTGRA